MPAWTYFGWLDHPLTASEDQLAHGRDGINVSNRIKQTGSGAVRVGQHRASSEPQGGGQAYWSPPGRQVPVPGSYLSPHAAGPPGRSVDRPGCLGTPAPTVRVFGIQVLPRMPGRHWLYQVQQMLRLVPARVPPLSASCVDVRVGVRQAVDLVGRGVHLLCLRLIGW